MLRRPLTFLVTGSRLCGTRLKSSMPSPIGKKEGLLGRMVKKVGFLDPTNSKLNVGGYLNYELCADKVDFPSFINEAGMTDTVFSWFLVTELHCWMVMARVMDDGKEGRVVRNAITSALWEDLSNRLQRLEVAHRNATLQDFADQFRAAIIGYDEGLLSSDIVLAGMLWRRLLGKNRTVEPETLEMLVAYVRRQIAALDQLPAENILFKPKYSWVSLKECKPP